MARAAAGPSMTGMLLKCSGGREGWDKGGLKCSRGKGGLVAEVQ